MQATAWMVLIESKFAASCRHDGHVPALLEARGSLLLKGLVLAHRISALSHTMLSLHLSQGLPFPARTLRPLSACAEILKAIEYTLVKHGAVVGESLSHVLRLLCGALLGQVAPLRRKLEASKRFDDHKLDVLAATHVVETLLHGSETLSYSRRSVIALALCVLTNPNMMSDAEAEQTLSLLKRVTLLAEWQNIVHTACDCSFLTWSRELLPLFIGQVMRECSLYRSKHQLPNSRAQTHQYPTRRSMACLPKQGACSMY